MSTLSGAGVLGGLASSTESATNSAALVRSRPWAEPQDSYAVPAVNAVLELLFNYCGAIPTLADNTTLQTVLSVTGSGMLRFCAAALYRMNYSVSLRVQIEVDGETYLDETATSAVGTDDPVCIYAVGRAYRTSSQVFSILERPLYYRSSLVIRVQKNTTLSTFKLGYTNLLASPYGG